jgi:hypothetical protein
LRFLATVRPTPDLHRRSTVQPRLPICLRLAPPANLRLCLPTQPPTLIGCQILQLALQLVSSLRLQPAVPLNLLADPSTRVSASALSLAFRSRLRLAPPAVPPACRPSDLKARALWPFVRLRLPFSFQLAPSADPPALPSNLASDSSVAASFGFAFVPTLQLSPPVNLLAVPSGQLPARAFRQPSSPAFEPACSLRRLPVPGSAFLPISGLRLPSTFRPTDRACLQLAPSTSLFGSAFRFASSLRRLPTFQPCLQTQPPTLIECLILRLACSRSPACAFNQHYLLNLLA